MKATIDEEKCIGCQTCAVMCSECFEMEEGVAKFIGSGDCGCDLQSTADSCPVEAIKIEE